MEFGSHLKSSEGNAGGFVFQNMVLAVRQEAKSLRGLRLGSAWEDVGLSWRTEQLWMRRRAALPGNKPGGRCRPGAQPASHVRVQGDGHVSGDCCGLGAPEACVRRGGRVGQSGGLILPVTDLCSAHSVPGVILDTAMQQHASLMELSFSWRQDKTDRQTAEPPWSVPAGDKCWGGKAKSRSPGRLLGGGDAL